MIQTEKIFSHYCTCCGYFWNDALEVTVEICPKCSNGKITQYTSMPKFENKYIDVCLNCSNDPRNGGTGVCNCAAPQMANPTMC